MQVHGGGLQRAHEYSDDLYGPEKVLGQGEQEVSALEGGGKATYPNPVFDS